jgi:hypothetical protein
VGFGFRARQRKLVRTTFNKLGYPANPQAEIKAVLSAIVVDDLDFSLEAGQGNLQASMELFEPVGDSTDYPLSTHTSHRASIQCNRSVSSTRTRPIRSRYRGVPRGGRRRIERSLPGRYQRRGPG